MEINLTSIQQYYTSGATKAYEERIAVLKSLKKTIVKHEASILNALYQDLKKSPEEAYASELGIVLQELSHTIKNLKQWMRPTAVDTDLLNFPSSSRLYKDPWGVVLIIAPWNYPFQLLMTPLIAAVAAGNCVVAKPSELAPATAAMLQTICKEACASKQITIVQGVGATIIPEMMQAFRFDYVFYTGSVAVGKSIYSMAAEKLTPVTLELGGKSPCIVYEDADLEVAAQRIVLGKFTNAGQTCIAPDYLLVHESIQDAFVQRLIQYIEEFYTSDASTSYDYGRIINQQRWATLVHYLQQGKIVYGGQHQAEDLYIAPTLLLLEQIDATVMQEEIFGPILPILSFTSTENVLAVIEKNAHPLALYLFTNNKTIQDRIIQSVPFGGGCINNTLYHFTNPNFPFGGVGNSGIGAYHGQYSFSTFSRLKPVLKTPNWFNPRFRFPSFKGRLGILKKLIR